MWEKGHFSQEWQQQLWEMQFLNLMWRYLSLSVLCITCDLINKYVYDSRPCIRNFHMNSSQFSFFFFSFLCTCVSCPFTLPYKQISIYIHTHTTPNVHPHAPFQIFSLTFTPSPTPCKNCHSFQLLSLLTYATLQFKPRLVRAEVFFVSKHGTW